MLLALLCLLAVFLGPVVGFSDGVDTICDALDPGFGTSIMGWATAPVRTDKYSLRTGDGDSRLDPTDFVPGRALVIHIRTLELGMKFRGLLLYAVDDNEDRVGEWDLTQELPQAFVHPPSCGENRKGVLHIAADRKPYHLEFRFIPPSGVERITFRCLIKQGNANTGAFFFPNLDKDLTLTRSLEAPPPQLWFQAAAGRDCTSECQKQGLVCDQSAMAAADTAAAFARAVEPFVRCNKPYYSSCSTAAGGPHAIEAVGDCFYSSGGCPNIGCTGSDPSLQRLCACQDASKLSAAGRDAGSANLLTAAAASTFLLLAGEGRAWHPGALGGVLLPLMLLLPAVSAHNWVHSNSRSDVASLTQPCIPRGSELPHVQVAAKQEFTVSWATGHDQHSETYFTILHEDDYTELFKINTAMLDEYIAEAPNAIQGETDTYWSKKHVPSQGSPVDAADYAYQLDETHPDVLSAAVVNNKRQLLPGGFGTQWEYKPEDKKRDVVARYKSAKYPWIEAVHRFKINTHRPSSMDIARVMMPAEKGPGRYIVHYLWHAYNDCIDVHVVDTPSVRNVYGVPSASSTWRRIDHCTFPDMKRTLYGPQQIFRSAESCIQACNAVAACDAVTVFPVRNPASVFPAFAENPTHETSAAFEKVAYACVAGEAREPSGNAEAEYETTLDPEDPIFYATCYKKETLVNFDHDPPSSGGSSQETASPWAFQGHCVSCIDRAIHELEREDNDAFIFPRWNVSKEQCQHCGIEDPPAPPTPPPELLTKMLEGVILQENSFCDGIDGVTNRDLSTPASSSCSAGTLCQKQLLRAGAENYNTGPSRADCKAMVERDPECSAVFTWSKTKYNGACYCQLMAPACCGDCLPVTDAYQSRYWDTSSTTF